MTKKKIEKIVTFEDAINAGFNYVGDKETKEYHSLRRMIKKGCGGDKIKLSNRVYGKTQKEMHEKGFDACGHRCVQKYRSRDNK